MDGGIPERILVMKIDVGKWMFEKVLVIQKNSDFLNTMCDDCYKELRMSKRRESIKLMS